ncbi:DUF6086 family protein [Nonomuraea rubra]|uniref:DUF6086 family protein n=1 Tax=Nonomuraea rubra TaxID=46180 RepID=UPI001C870323
MSALVERCERTNHSSLHALMEGFIATALVLGQRGGGAVRVSRPSTGLPEDGTAGRWAELAARHARAMPH